MSSLPLTPSDLRTGCLQCQEEAVCLGHVIEEYLWALVLQSANNIKKDDGFPVMTISIYDLFMQAALRKVNNIVRRHISSYHST